MGRAIGWSDLAGLGEGVLGGAVGTAAFTGWMKGAQHIGLLGELPPRKITREVLDKVSAPSKTTIEWATAATHLGFGVGIGALFGVVSRKLGVRVPGAVQGAVWGSLVWVASYAGVLPALDLMPPPQRDRPDRPVVMFLGHLLFGSILGAIAGRRTR